MEAAESLKQTVTHLFDAVRFADDANELEESAKNVEGELETALNKVESLSEEVYNTLTTLKEDQDPVLKELSQQVQDFLATARDQAKARLHKRASEQQAEYKSSAIAEKEKAIKSLEAFFASDPLPLVETAVQVKLSEGIYEARSKHECEGGIKYEFRLASQNSRIFHEALQLSQLGYELKIPVRFSRSLLSKARVPGFERLDQYVLTDAESSEGKLRANFEKGENEAQMKVVTSGEKAASFVSIDYSDPILGVNVMNDPSLVAFVDVAAIKKAAGDIVSELGDLEQKKVALIRLGVNGENLLDSPSSRLVLEKVLEVMGPAYKAQVRKLAEGAGASGSGDELSLEFITGRLKTLGERLSGTVAQALGITVPAK